MKKILYIIIFIPLVFLGQSKQFKKDYKKQLKSPSFLFLSDWSESNYDNITYKENVLEKIISESGKYGYKLLRENDRFIGIEGVFKFILLEKDIFDNNFEFFPRNSIGTVRKQFYFSGKKIDDAIVIKVVTEIILFQPSYMSSSSILSYSEFLKNFIKRSYLERFNLESSSVKFDSKSMTGGYYDLVDVFKIWRKDNLSDYKVEKILSIGNGIEQKMMSDGSFSNIHKIVFSVESPLTYGVNTLIKKTTSQSNKLNNDLRFMIGGNDIRKSNIYDLKSMVNVFLEDCKKNNITTPQINTLKATFEPLDGSTIGLSYGYNDDSVIIIKVDPKKWEKSSIQKKWYILYHELGHDVLNLEHGEGGKMMYNFADRDYSWDEFFEDKKYMINSIK